MSVDVLKEWLTVANFALIAVGAFAHLWVYRNVVGPLKQAIAEEKAARELALTALAGSMNVFSGNVTKLTDAVDRLSANVTPILVEQGRLAERINFVNSRIDRWDGPYRGDRE